MTKSCSTNANSQSIRWHGHLASLLTHRQHFLNVSTQCWPTHRCFRISNNISSANPSLMKSNKPTRWGQNSHIGNGNTCPTRKTPIPGSRFITIRVASMSMTLSTPRSLNMLTYISWSRWPFAKFISHDSCSCHSKPNAHECDTPREASRY